MVSARAKQTQFPAVGQDPKSRLRKTKPIPGGAGWDEAWGTRGLGQLCKANPICHSSTGRGAGGKKRKSPRGRGQMRQTKPIGTGATSKASPVWTRNYGELSMHTRPAKQSQFPTDGAGRPSPRPEALTLPPAGRQSCDIASMPRFGKQSQSLDYGLRIEDRPVASSPREPVVQTKPIGRSLKSEV
jgi:hypothetical protein